MPRRSIVTMPARSIAHGRSGRSGMELDDWVETVAAALGAPALAESVDVDAVLALARDAAHAVARPAAPVTAFLVGYAAGLAGGGPTAVSEAMTAARHAAANWQAAPGDG